jgi:hypothetical protein
LLERCDKDLPGVRQSSIPIKNNGLKFYHD